ncbi:ERV-BabFcenv provirus ancestral Env polyprotein-like isoform X2 [Callithrix jacchus]|uniref:ERV-BabFcenv provirus ancestral Env polyprotein-like isoform X2 n=1 Tax=Callithrix jacchus TaxID=9483 RepID=UPI0023DD2612|nr:ERV-BabFcenv provirus ancestral Env polyprotein-like isoform X2 [Callithrix jacchus]
MASTPKGLSLRDQYHKLSILTLIYLAGVCPHLSRNPQHDPSARNYIKNSAPFSWLTLMREGLKLTNQTGLTNLTSCLLCATLGQTPLVAVPTMFPTHHTNGTGRHPPIPDVPLFYLNTSPFSACYSSQSSDPTCNRTQQLTTNLTAPRGFYFWCNGTLSKLLTQSDLRGHSHCLPVTLVPCLTVYSLAEFLMMHTSMSSAHPSSHRQRRAAFLPIAIGLSLAGSTAALGLGSGALINTHQALACLSSQLQTAIDDSAASVASLQRQVTSVAQVALQNRRALDLLTAEQGGTCIFLQEECCYYINESGIVETRIENLQKIKAELQSHQFTTEATAWWSSSMYTLLSPLIGPLLIICLFLLVAPCFFQFLQRHFQELTRITINQMLLQPVPSHPDCALPAVRRKTLRRCSVLPDNNQEPIIAAEKPAKPRPILNRHITL